MFRGCCGRFVSARLVEQYHKFMWCVKIQQYIYENKEECMRRLVLNRPNCRSEAVEGGRGGAGRGPPEGLPTTQVV